MIAVKALKIVKIGFSSSSWQRKMATCDNWNFLLQQHENAAGVLVACGQYETREMARWAAIETVAHSTAPASTCTARVGDVMKDLINNGKYAGYIDRYRDVFKATLCKNLKRSDVVGGKLHSKYLIGRRDAQQGGSVTVQVPGDAMTQTLADVAKNVADVANNGLNVANNSFKALETLTQNHQLGLKHQQLMVETVVGAMKPQPFLQHYPVYYQQQLAYPCPQLMPASPQVELNHPQFMAHLGHVSSAPSPGYNPMAFLHGAYGPPPQPVPQNYQFMPDSPQVERNHPQFTAHSGHNHMAFSLGAYPPPPVPQNHLQYLHPQQQQVQGPPQQPGAASFYQYQNDATVGTPPQRQVGSDPASMQAGFGTFPETLLRSNGQHYPLSHQQVRSDPASTGVQQLPAGLGQAAYPLQSTGQPSTWSHPQAYGMMPHPQVFGPPELQQAGNGMDPAGVPGVDQMQVEEENLQ
jgi:hypothetical protein